MELAAHESRLVVVSHSQSEQGGKISCAVNDTDHLNRPRLPHVGNDVGVEVPEALLSAQKFIVIVPNAGRPPQRSEALIEFRPEALGGIWAILGNLEENLLQVPLGFRGENERPFH